MSEENKRKTRYNDTELAEFEAMINQKLVDAKKELQARKDELKELNNSGDENRAGTFDDGASNWQRENLSKLAVRQQKFIRNLEYALIRIKNKTYGVCSATGELIEKKRLMLVPHATKSIQGKITTQGEIKKQETPKFFKE
ncbi:MAG: TraR/DksA family transcriptional regulator [Aureispira sp.]